MRTHRETQYGWNQVELPTTIEVANTQPCLWLNRKHALQPNCIHRASGDGAYLGLLRMET